MSDERFDKLLKKNLESVSTAYQPTAWNRFRKRLPVAGFWPWLHQHGGWVLSALMLTGWMTTLYSLHENQQVIRQFTEKMDLATRPASAVSASAVTKAPQRMDTVYVVKRTVVDHRHYYQTEQGQWTTTPFANPTEASRFSLSNNLRAPRNRTDNRGWIASSNVRNRLARSLKNKPGNRSSDNPNETANREVAAADSATVFTPIPLAEKTGSVTDSAAAESVSPVVDAPAPQAPVTAAVAPKIRHPFRLSSLHPRVGVESMATLNSIGLGPAVEAFPDANLGISIGLQASRSSTENLQALRDFNEATGQEFIEVYRPYLPAQFNRITNISIQTSVISLPVSLKYYVPLRRALSLFIQTGTSFDLSAYQQVDFDSYLYRQPRRHTFETDTESRFFHNFMLGAGIQYRRPRISAQLSPYYIYDFRSTLNTAKGSNLGARASVWVDLFR
ncbi:hypothetical protein [Larkinella rosea]|uniref:Uncharacterized protein n=1 Tax=Larkinella rosea TaxID=2025312 RepID=A0A3P1BTQ6_9BACT|nr:hypothetical protein [Larkinella rosea]RRB04495.1 hypothetical protein EHT25_13450 [Larkinella rosea]